MKQIEGYILTTEKDGHCDGENVVILTTATSRYGGNEWSNCASGRKRSPARFKIWKTKKAAEKAQAAGKFVGNYSHAPLKTTLMCAEDLLYYGYSVYTSSTHTGEPKITANAWVVRIGQSRYPPTLQGAIARDYDHQERKLASENQRHQVELHAIGRNMRTLDNVVPNDLVIRYEGDK